SCCRQAGPVSAAWDPSQGRSGRHPRTRRPPRTPAGRRPQPVSPPPHSWFPETYVSACLVTPSACASPTTLRHRKFLFRKTAPCLRVRLSVAPPQVVLSLRRARF